MGEIAEAMLSGLFCEGCGEVFDDFDEPGYVRYCETCERHRRTPMPPKSQAQRGAMAAAARGKSTLNIPAKVGKEFMAADKGGKLPKKAPQPKKGK